MKHFRFIVNDRALVHHVPQSRLSLGETLLTFEYTNMRLIN